VTSVSAVIPRQAPEEPLEIHLIGGWMPLLSPYQQCQSTEETQGTAADQVNFHVGRHFWPTRERIHTMQVLHPWELILRDAITNLPATLAPYYINYI